MKNPLFSINPLVPVFLFLGALPSGGAQVSGTFPLVTETGFNRLTVKIKATQNETTVQDTETSTLTGAMNARLMVNVATGKVSGLEFTGGNVNFSNLSFDFLVAGFFSVATATTNGLVGSPSTPAPPALVETATGNFNAALHEFTINAGTLTTNAAGETSTIDFAAEPAGGPGVGTGTIVLTELTAQATVATRTWRAVLTLPLNSTQADPDSGAQITMTGTLKGIQNFVIPRTEFHAWTMEGGLGTPPFDSILPNGARAGMVWALGLAPGNLPDAHFPVVSAVGPAATITLPAVGTAAPLTVEISDNLSSWSDAPPATLSGGVNPLPQGSVGAVTVSLSGPKKFVRLRAVGP